VTTRFGLWRAARPGRPPSVRGSRAAAAKETKEETGKKQGERDNMQLPRLAVEAAVVPHRRPHFAPSSPPPRTAPCQARPSHLIIKLVWPPPPASGSLSFRSRMFLPRSFALSVPTPCWKVWPRSLLLWKVWGLAPLTASFTCRPPTWTKNY
jgi:hypothetical protein